MPRRSREHEIVIDKLIHGGQGLGSLENGKRALVWGVLPGERVRFRETKRRSDYVEGVVSEILMPSADRIEPRDELYLSTSPWQIMGYELENKYKKDILGETLARADVELKSDVSFVAPQSSWRYRNKMEYSFFGDEQGLHLALFNRGSHRKQIVAGSSIARPEIDKAAQSICKILSDSGVRAGDLKSLIIRCNQSGECVAALITRNESFGKIDDLKDVCKGLIVVFSNPLSPASVRTKDLYTFGYIELTDTLLGNTVKYVVFSFFQVNLPIFEDALKQMQKAINDESIVDMYAGVGSIGAALGKVRYSVESDPANTTHAKENIGPQKVIEASSEKALDYIERKSVLIVDPPRSGLHKVLVEKILEICPEKVVYLSCNPSTQARDLKLLSESYGIETITGYNFFPRTPHIESLAILVRQ